MIKTYTLRGLDCANCAAKIENAVKKISGVQSATVNFVKLTLTVDVKEQHFDGITETVTKIVRKYEPEVAVEEKHGRENGVNLEEHGAAGKYKSAWLITGIALFTAGMLFEYGAGANRLIAIGLFASSYLLAGAKVLWRMFRNISKGQIFDENFLMGVATLGAIAIGEYSGAAAVMVFYQTGEFFQDKAVAKSKRSIAELMDIRPDYANLQADDKQLRKVDPREVNIGDIIVVKPGEKIPLDGVVVSGEAQLNMSHLTGESLPKKVGVSDEVLSGSVNQNGVLTIKAGKTFGQSTVSKIIDLVENAASRKAKVETFITKFARYYTPAVMAMALLLATVPPLFFAGEWGDWIYRSLVLLIIACPCALVMSIPLGFFAGIGTASKKGIMVKGGNYLEALAALDIIVFDKTGTLTKGQFKVGAVKNANNFTESQVLQAGAFAEVFSNHPIARSILDAYCEGIDKSGLSQYSEIAGCGVSVRSGSQTILAGNEKLMKMRGVNFIENSDFGTKVYVAIDNAYAGCILIYDEIKPDSRAAIAALKTLGVRKTVMLTGDTMEVAQNVAEQTNIDEVYAHLLPQDKVEKLELLKNQTQPRKALAFVGDGINDAPVLAFADVGVAMGALGSDAAIEAADVVLMTDEPSKLAEAVKVARFTKRVIWQNIIFALGVQFLFLFLGAAGVASIWEAIFADVGVSLLAVLNTWRLLKN